MSDHTGIEWTDATWNPVVGCTKVSQGCKHCYAKQIHDMRHKAHNAGRKVAPQYAQPFEEVQLMSERLDAPLSWRRPRKVFVNSVSDLFHEDVPENFIALVFSTMACAPRHSFQVLTKRADRMRAVLSSPDFADAVESLSGQIAIEQSDPLDRRTNDLRATVTGELPLRNVWLGVSIENQAAADERIPLLISTPASVRFLSCEPLLGPVDVSPYMGRTPNITGERIVGFSDLNWVIVGGESGNGARPMHPNWARLIRDRCDAAGVPFFFKQWGEWRPDEARRWEDAPVGAARERYDIINLVGGSGYHGEGAMWTERVGKKRAGRDLDGRTWGEFPKVAP